MSKKISRTSRPISIKLDRNHLSVKGMRNCSIEGSGSFPRGDNHRNAKIEWSHIIIFLSGTTEPEELIFTRKLSGIM
jgi:hypothetical protein